MYVYKSLGSAATGVLGFTVSYAVVKEAASFAVIVITLAAAVTGYVWAWRDRLKKRK